MACTDTVKYTHKRHKFSEIQAKKMCLCWSPHHWLCTNISSCKHSFCGVSVLNSDDMVPIQSSWSDNPIRLKEVKLCLFSGASSSLAAGLSLSQKTTDELQLYSSWLHIELRDAHSSLHLLHDSYISTRAAAEKSLNKNLNLWTRTFPTLFLFTEKTSVNINMLWFCFVEYSRGLQRK